MNKKIPLIALPILAMSLTSCVLSYRSDYPKQTLYFSISPRQNNFSLNDDSAIKEVVSVMKTRMKKADVGSFKISIESLDVFKVTFRGDQYDCSYVAGYLSHNGHITISNSKNTYAYSEDFLDANNPAYLIKPDDNNSDFVVTIVIPIDRNSEAFKMVYDEARQMEDEGTGEVVEIVDEIEDQEEPEATHRACLYLWGDYKAGDYDYRYIDTNSADYNKNIASQVLITFPVADPFLDENQNALKTYVRTSLNKDKNREVAISAMRKVYSLANYFVNIINCKTLDYDITFLNRYK